MLVNYRLITKHATDVRFVSLKCSDCEERLIKRQSFSPPLSEILLAVTQGIFTAATGKPGILAITETDHETVTFIATSEISAGWLDCWLDSQQD